MLKLEAPNRSGQHGQMHRNASSEAKAEGIGIGIGIILSGNI